MRLRPEREVFDPHELAARRSDPEWAALEPLPPPPRRIRPLALLLGLFVVVLLAATRQHSPGRRPALAASCTVPAFRLSASSAKSFGVLRWAAVGPTGSALVFGLDSARLPTGPARPGSAGKLLGPARLVDCAAGGQFGVPAEQGEHTVTAFLVGSDGRVRTIGSVRLSVSPS